MEKKTETKNIPKSAFSFMDTEAFAKPTGDGEKNVEILAYSGKIIKNHWWWGDLAIDLSGMVANKKFYPVLEQHDISRKVGFTAKPIVRDNQLRHDQMTYLDTVSSKEFENLSKTGFPYEASISGKPLIVESLDDGQTAEVNGFTMKGPGSIWRKWEYREVSICVFGYDPNTKSKAMSEGDCADVNFESLKKEETQIGEKTNEKEVTNLDLKKLKEEHPEQYEAFVEEVKGIVGVEFSEKEKGMTATIELLRTELAESNKKILEADKRETLRKEKETRLTAEAIFSKKLLDSEIPERLHEKVKKQISFEAFIKDGVLDETAFSAAIDTEIKDWIGQGVKSSVLGFGATEKTETDSEKAEMAENKAWLEKMQSFAGQTKH